jgi:uncharacterized protein YgiB involved in biofilm formation
MTQDNHRTTTIRYLLIASGVLVVGGLGYLAYDLLNPSQDVIYYASEQQCIADAVAKKNGLTQEECHVQFQYAMQEYERITPIYGSQQDCQEDIAGSCSPVSASSGGSGWRPDFGGTYFTSNGNDGDRTVVYLGSGRYQSVYPVQPVYRSGSEIVTLSGTRIASPQTGVLLESRYFSPSNTAPVRPQGHAARGTIKGRGSFGSSVRSTAPKGSGGK